MMKHTRARGSQLILLLFLSLPVILFTGCNGNTINLGGLVWSGNQPVQFATVSLFRTGTGQGPQLIDQTQSDENGAFSFSFDRPDDDNAVFYLTAGGNPPLTPLSTQVLSNENILLATVLGHSNFPRGVLINERSTVATAFAMAQFFNSGGIDGSSPGLQNAAAIVRNLVNIENGQVASMLGTFPNGEFNQSRDMFNSLANLLALCVNDASQCPNLFDLATTPDGEVPVNTLEAALNIAHFPWQNVAELLNLSQSSSLYSPALPADAGLTAWVLALVYNGGGGVLDGPGNLAFDAWGNAWINNNYVFNEGVEDPNGIVCGGDTVVQLSPTGENVGGSPFTGGGLYGSGFGIALDPDGDVWLTNFGFQGTNCPFNLEELSQTVSEFAGDGTPISPNSQGNQSGLDHGGYQGAGNLLRRPQGMISDRDGNIWMASCDNSLLVQFPGGDPDGAFAITPTGNMGQNLLDTPFDVAVDTSGLGWVTSNHNDSIFAFDALGNLVFSIRGQDAKDGGIEFPMGIAADRLGNLWVANGGLPSPPCRPFEWQSVLREIVRFFNEGGRVGGASVSMITPDGVAIGPFKGGGLIYPWGIAVDGDDNVWVSNFHGQRVSYFCGARPETCPPGFDTGDPISPDGGYGFDGLVRNTGLQVDPSGNVWTVQNWIPIPVPTNPGGRAVVVFIGVAKPVKTPLVGAPRI